MHILFLSHYFPPEVNAPASRTYEHARRWVQEPDTQVTVITNHPHHPYGILYPGYLNHWLSCEQKDGIQVRRVKTYLAPNAGLVRRTLNYLCFMVMAIIDAIKLPRPDLVLATSPQFFCAVAGYLISSLKRCAFVFELRDLWPESIVAVEAITPGLIIRILEKLELYLYRQASLIVAVTDSFKKNLIARGIPASKIQVIKNGVDLTFFQPKKAPAVLREEIGAGDRFVAAYIGTVGMAHAVDKIILAAVQLQTRSNILFVIVGEGAQKRAIEELVNSRGIKNVKVLPGVDKEMVKDYYALSDINLVTLRKSDLFTSVIPSKIFEIMAMGRPTLTTVDGECRQIIEEARAGFFVDPENVEQLAATLATLSLEPELMATMGANGRHYVEQHSSRELLALRYLNLLHQVAVRC